MRRTAVLVALVAVAGLVAVSCQTGVSMWSSCSASADGNPWGTDGKYVLLCEGGQWVPKMTVAEFAAVAKGGHPTIAALPARPTTTTSTTSTTSTSTSTTVPRSTVDQSNVGESTEFVVPCPSLGEVMQTFTAGRTGTLDTVSLGLITGSSPVGMDISIRNFDPTIGPLDQLGSGSTTVPSNRAAGFTDIALSSPAHVESGTQYVIVVGLHTPCAALSIRTGLGTYAGGDIWTPVLGGFSPSPYDLAFQTWVL